MSNYSIEMCIREFISYYVIVFIENDNNIVIEKRANHLSLVLSDYSNYYLRRATKV